MISYKDHARICRETAEEMDALGEKRTKLALERLARKYEQAGNKEKRKEAKDGSHRQQ
jgi:hypothetical protein